ncbi:hypothetical protein DENSPDRAFT_804521 [Dentipellis sp. KUC8613]|nr:hypothetical protein DENSPDRAFT_804521 [Dentipellis sp. KUC8613]
MSAASIAIVDVRASDETHQKNEVLEGLTRPEGQKYLPTLLLYDERGLQLYDDITTSAEEYYLFPAEVLLKTHADDIVQAIHGASEGEITEGEVFLELGAGALRKTSHILSALARDIPEGSVAAPVTYYALDLDERELKRTLTELSNILEPELRGKVEMKGTYDGGIKFIEECGLWGRDAANHTVPSGHSVSPTSSTFSDGDAPSRSDSNTAPSTTETNAVKAVSIDTAPSTPDSMPAHAPLHIMLLGSSLGNFACGADTEFLKSLPLRPGSGDTLLLGLDHCQDEEKIVPAYNDAKGLTKSFVMNGLKGAGRALGDEALFDENKWEYVGRYDAHNHCHEAFYQAKYAHTIRVPETKQEISFVAGELVNVAVSRKFPSLTRSYYASWSIFFPVHRVVRGFPVHRCLISSHSTLD